MTIILACIESDMNPADLLWETGNIAGKIINVNDAGNLS